jgi:uncharacterized repeat protein (TIGR01451 family)
MDARLIDVRLLRAAAIVTVSFAMVCGLLILFGRVAPQAMAAPLADTLVSSDITVDTTWTLAGSPYIVSTDTVAVRNGAKLTIQPGVEVRFQAGAQLQMRDGGQLEAIGTPTQPITFTSDNLLVPDRGDWSGIRFDAYGLTGTIQYAVIEYAQVGVELNAVGQYYNVSSNTLRYIGDYDGNPANSGVIIGVPDGSDFSYNTVYSSEVGIRLNKAFGNVIRGNHIYDIDADCIALLSAEPGSPGGGGNQFIENQLQDCRANGIRLEGGGVGDNQVIGNLIWDTYNEGVYVINQSNLQFRSNTIYNTAFTTTTGTGGLGSNLGGAAFFNVNGIDAQDNYLYGNGSAASATYAGALYVQDAGGSGSMIITGMRVRDNYASGLVFDGTNDPSSHTINNNAICVDDRYEIENRDGALAANGNWLGTNFPTAGTEYTGTVTVLPTIQLGISPAATSLIADGATTTTLTVTFSDSAGHVVPPGARDVAVATSAGTLSTNVVTVDDTGQATLILTSSSTPATAVVTATDWCGYTVTETVTFAGYVDLSVSKTASPPPYSPGSLITYTISYRNNGNTSASGVVLTETLPVSTAFAAPAGWTQVGSTNQYIQDVGYLSPLSGTLTTIFVVRIADDLPAGDASFTNLVRIGDDGTSGADYDPTDNVFTLTVSGGNLPDLWVVKNDNVGPGALSGPMASVLANTASGPGILQMLQSMDGLGAQAVPEGGLITYTIGYGNSSQGTAPATGVVLSETLPLYTTYAGPACGQPEGWCQVDATRTYTRFVGGPWNPVTGDSAYFTVRVSGSLPPTVSEVINTICIYGNEEDLIPGNNCSNEQTPVITGTYDLSVIKVANATCLNPGDALNYQITIQNLGVNDASNGVLQEALPANTTPINLPGSGWMDAGAGIYTYSLGSVTSSTIRTVPFWVQIDPNLAPSVSSITNVVSVQAEGADSDASNNSYTLVTPLGTTPDLAITKNDNTSAEVAPGDVITYSIGYVNDSHRFAATHVVITDTLPPGTIITGSSESSWHQVGTSNLYTRSVGTLGPNQAGSVQLTLQLANTTPYPFGSEVVNRVEIGGAEAECDLSDNFATEETPVQGANAADLAVTKADNVPFCAVPGDVIAYTITYTNNSYTIPAEDVLLTEIIDPLAVTFLGPPEWSGGGSTYTRTPITPTVAPRAGGAFTFNVEIADTIPDGQESITNVVRIATTSPDWNLANNVYTLTTYVPEWPDLFVIKNDNVTSLGLSAMGELDKLISRLQFPPQALALLQSSLSSSRIGAMAESVNPGDTITYTIILGNIGRAPSSGVVLTDTLPAGTTFVGPGYWHQVGSSNLYTYSVGSLNDSLGDVKEFIVRVNDPFLAGSRVINTVQIGGNEVECDTDNNSSTDETPVAGAGFANSVYLPLILKNYPETPPTPIPTIPPPPTPTPTPRPLAWVSDVAVDPDTNRVFVASPRQDAVHVIEGGPDSYNQSVAVGHGPTGLAVLTSTGTSKVFVVHAYDWTPGMWFIDASSLNGHSMADQDGYLGSAPFKVAVNSFTDRSFVSNYYDKMPIVDAVSEMRLAWVQKKNFIAAYGIEVSQRSNLVYMATIDTGELIVFDAAQAENASDVYGACHHAPPEARVLRMVGFNEATGHLFVTSPPDLNKGQTDSEVFVLDEDKLLAETAKHGGRPSDETCLWNFGINAEDISVAAIPGPAWITNPVGLPGAVSAGEEGIAVNPATGRVYVTDGPGDRLFVLQDSITPTNISLVATIANVGDNPQGVAVNPQTNKVYVANARNIDAPYGTVSVVDGASNVVIKTISLGP